MQKHLQSPNFLRSAYWWGVGVGVGGEGNISLFFEILCFLKPEISYVFFYDVTVENSFSD